MYDVAFWLLALVSVGSALALIFTRNLFRAALFLALLFFTIAGVYVALDADFLAAAQVLIYIGAVTVLIVLAIMLTRDIRQANHPNRMRVRAALVSAALLGLIIFTIAATPWQTSPVPPVEPTTGPLGAQLFAPTGYLLPVEISAVLLLSAAIGAIVLMRDK